MVSRLRRPGIQTFSIGHKDQERHETAAGGRWRNQAEADGSSWRRKWHRRKQNRSVFTENWAHGMLVLQICSPDIAIIGPDMLPSETRTRSYPERKMAEDDGSRRKLTHAKNEINIARIGRFPPQNRHNACWVSRYALPTSSIWPPHMLPSDTQTRGGPKRKVTADGGR